MTTTKQRLRAICYARVSTEEQGTEEHFSIEAQLNEMSEFAQRRGWDILAHLIDTMSGTRRDRPQLEAALEMVKKTRVRCAPRPRTLAPVAFGARHPRHL